MAMFHSSVAVSGEDSQVRWLAPQQLLEDSTLGNLRLQALPGQGNIRMVSLKNVLKSW